MATLIDPDVDLVWNPKVFRPRRPYRVEKVKLKSFTFEQNFSRQREPGPERFAGSAALLSADHSSLVGRLLWSGGMRWGYFHDLGYQWFKTGLANGGADCWLVGFLQSKCPHSHRVKTFFFFFFFYKGSKTCMMRSLSFAWFYNPSAPSVVLLWRLGPGVCLFWSFWRFWRGHCWAWAQASKINAFGMSLKSRCIKTFFPRWLCLFMLGDGGRWKYCVDILWPFYSNDVHTYVEEHLESRRSPPFSNQLLQIFCICHEAHQSTSVPSNKPNPT